MKLSFVIVEYHSISDVLQCVSSINESNLLSDYEVIISSNSCYSENLQKECIKTDFLEKVIWLFNKRNGGFAYAMNRGLRIATGDVLIIMNPDVRIQSGLNEMLMFFYSNKEIGAIAPQMLSECGAIQDSSRNFITIGRFFSRQIYRVLLSKLYKDKGIDFSKVQFVDWVIGAFIAVKRDVYEKTEGLDEKYFLYCEDMDWCTRIWNSGYKIMYYPLAKITYEGTRTARRSIKYSRIFLHSLIHYWSKFGFFHITRS